MKVKYLLSKDKKKTKEICPAAFTFHGNKGKKKN